jgi:hypothetical protein
VLVLYLAIDIESDVESRSVVLEVEVVGEVAALQDEKRKTNHIRIIKKNLMFFIFIPYLTKL